MKDADSRDVEGWTHRRAAGIYRKLSRPFEARTQWIAIEQSGRPSTQLASCRLIWIPQNQVNT